MRSKGLMASAFALAVIFLMAMAAPSWAALRCTGPIGAVEIKGTVHAGPGCDLSRATVKGEVIVDPGGSLRTKEATTTEITGNVEGDNAAFVVLNGRAAVGGRLRLTGTKGVVNVGTPEGRSGGRGSVKGNIEIGHGASFALVFGENVRGSVQVLSNTAEPAGAREGVPGDVTVGNDTVGGNVELGNNSLANEVEAVVEVRTTSVAGNLQVFNNTETKIGETVLIFEAGFDLVANHVGGNAELLNNINNTGIGGTGVSENVVTNILNCVGNVPPPFAFRANTAKQKLGQCALL